MHEMTIAQSLFDMIRAESKKHNARPVAAKLSCGAFEAINEQILSFAFEAIAKDSVCAGVRLVMEHKPIQARCGGCNSVFEFDVAKPGCEKCGSDQFELLPDAPFVLEEIEFEME